VLSAQRLMMQKNNTLLNIIGLVIYIMCIYYYILFMVLKPFIARINATSSIGICGYSQVGIIRKGIFFFPPKRLDDLAQQSSCIHRSSSRAESILTIVDCYCCNDRTHAHRRRCHNTTLLHIICTIIYYYTAHAYIPLFFYSET